MKLAKTIIYALFTIWSLGFFYFIYEIENYVLDNKNITDVIVVFGEDKQRIYAASGLLKFGYAPIIFIAGSSDVSHYKSFLKEQGVSEHQLIFDREFVNNDKNYAIDTLLFSKKYGINSFRVVTSTQEMPRAMAELNRYLVNNLVIAHPVSIKKKDYTSIFVEYNKYVLIMIASIFGLQDELNISYS